MKPIIALLLISVASAQTTTGTRTLATMNSADGSHSVFYAPPCDVGDHMAGDGLPAWCEHITKSKKAKPKPSVKKKECPKTLAPAPVEKGAK